MQKLDPEVQQTGAVESRPHSSTEERPGSLDASVINGAKRGMGISDLPVIFDLPHFSGGEASRRVRPLCPPGPPEVLRTLPQRSL